jgi:dTDP-4-amino-4,6-dideoxygalactose transaminase
MEVAYSEALEGYMPDLKIGPGVFPLNRLETSNWDLIASLPHLKQNGALDSLQAEFRHLTGSKHIFFAPSCRAAIAQVLSLLPQAEVVIPAYSCAVVRVAAEVARKHIIYADVASGTVNSTAAEFDKHARPGRVLIPTHLFGVPTDIERICELARQRGCITIEDGAGALGMRSGQKMLGTFGDVGIFSFERSKRFPAFSGAVIVVNNEELFDPKRLADALPIAANDEAPLRDIVSAVFYNVASMRWLYRYWVVPRQMQMFSQWTPASASQTLDQAVQNKFFQRRFHSYQAALVLRMLSRLEQIRRRIIRLAGIYVEEFRDSPIMTFVPKDCQDLAILRFPIAIPNIKRAEVLRRALERGLFLETNYERLLPHRLSADDDLRNARWAAENIILLPLYTSLAEDDARRIAQQLIAIARGEN